MLTLFSLTPFLGFVAWIVFMWNHLEPWALMWLIGFAVFFGFKFLTVYQVSKFKQLRFSWLRLMLYLFCWFGMDARQFLNPESRLAKPEPHFGLWVLICAAIGTFLIWGVPRVFPVSEYAQAWFGITGVFYLLYFTVFQWNSLILRYAGVHAQPLMDKPFLMPSLADFWGKRWNMAFRQLMYDFFFKSISMREGPHFAAWLIFFMSGFFHELIFSLPARGGWGLPMLYFMIQWAGVRFEKTKWARKNLRRKFAGRVFAYMLLLIPIKLLFHDPFIYRVIIPFLHVIHSI